MKFSNYKTKSVFFYLLLSYFCIMLFPLLINFAAYYQIQRIVESEITSANIGMQKQLQLMLDNQLRDIKKLTPQIAFNTNLQKLLYLKANLTPSDWYAVAQLANNLNIYGVSNAFVNNFFVYFKNSDLIVTPKASYSSKDYYSMGYKTENMSYDEFHEMLFKQHTSNNYLPFYMVDSTGKTSKSLAVFQSLPLEDTVQSAATWVILLDETWFQEAIKNARAISQGKIFIMDKQNNILFSTHQQEELSGIRVETLIPPDGIVYDRLNGEEVVLSYSTSATTGWKYLTVLPKTVFSEKSTQVRRLVELSIFLCFIMGCLFTYLFMKKNYSPLQDLVKTLSKKTGVAHSRSENEISFIKELSFKVIDQNKEFEGKLKQNIAILRTNFLTRLLKGKLDDYSFIKDTLASYDIPFPSDHFAVILFRVEDYGCLFSNELEESNKNMNLCFFIISNIVEELTAENHAGVVTEIDELQVCLVNISESGLLSAKAELMEITQKVRQLMEEKFQVVVTIAISDINQQALSIPQAYQKALKALEYRMVYGAGSIIDYTDIKKSEMIFNYSVKIELQLSNFIKTGDYEKARLLIEQIFQQNFTQKVPSLQMGKCLLFNLISTFFKTLEEMGLSLDDTIMEKHDTLTRLLDSQTIAEIKSNMLEILQKVCFYIESNKKSHNHDLRDSIMDFIRVNYTNPGLSLTMIAEHFDMSPTYLSSFFKEQNGKGLNDYMNGIRIGASKLMLLETDESIKTIGDKVGYSNFNSFIKIFKKYEGITPGQYREAHSKSSM